MKIKQNNRTTIQLLLLLLVLTLSISSCSTNRRTKGFKPKRTGRHNCGCMNQWEEKASAISLFYQKNALQS